MVHAPRAGTAAAAPLPQGFEPSDFLLGRRGAGRPVRGVAGGKVKVGQTIAFCGLSCFAKLRHLHHAAPSNQPAGYTEGAATFPMDDANKPDRIESIERILQQVAAAQQRTQERHEALAETVELLTRDAQQDAENIRKDAENIRALARNSQILHDSIKGLQTRSEEHTSE